jgi:hypothetical protein
MKRFLQTFTILLLVCSFKTSFATHNAGGYITYTNVGKDSFMVSTVLYRDCNGILFNPSNERLLVICEKTNDTLYNKVLQLPTPIDITPTCDNACTRCESRGCSWPYGFEEYITNTLIVLNTSCCEIIFSYNRCCRNTTITTGMASASFYFETTFNRCLAPNNSSPRFIDDTYPIICIGQDTYINHSTWDTDKDSYGNLVDSVSYELVNPLGQGRVNLSYSGQYDYYKPILFWGFPNVSLPMPRGLHLDANTGTLSFQPRKVEQTVYAIKVNEYRNGVKIGEIIKDQQIIVISCPNNQALQLSGPYYKEYCLGDTVRFTINTFDFDIYDTLSLEYEGEIPGAVFTVDSAKHPTGYFTWVPDSNLQNQTFNFFIKVIDDACPVAGTNHANYQFVIHRKPDSINIKTKYLKCNDFELEVLPYPNQLNNYKWYFPPDTSLKSTNTSLTKKFPTNGRYPVKLVVNDFGSSCRYVLADSLNITKALDFLMQDTIYKCPGDSLIIIPNPAKNKQNYIYEWHQWSTSFSIKDTFPEFRKKN